MPVTYQTEMSLLCNILLIRESKELLLRCWTGTCCEGFKTWI